MDHALNTWNNTLKVIVLSPKMIISEDIIIFDEMKKEIPSFIDFFHGILKKKQQK